MHLVELTGKERSSYNHFVAVNKGSFLQSWEWGMWQAVLGRQVRRFKIIAGDDSKGESFAEAKDSPLHEKWLGGVQFIKMPLPFGQEYWYAPYGPVFAGDQSIKYPRRYGRDRQVSSIKQKLEPIFPQALFVRLEPQGEVEGIEAVAKKTTNIQPAVTILSDIQKSDEELLLAMHPKTRYNIRLAERHGVTIESELAITPGFGLYAKEAVDLILQTQKRQKYRGHSGEYYRKLIDLLAIQNHGSELGLTVYKALHNRELLAAGIMMDFGSTRVYLYGGSSEERKNIMAPYLLHWQAMRDARERGLLFYDFGGSEVSSGGERGFTRFKQGFGGRVVSYMGAYDVVCKPSVYWLYNILRKLNLFVRKFI